MTEAVRRTIAASIRSCRACRADAGGHYAEENEPLRLIARTAAGLGAVSLLLALSGLYSVIAFFVALRTNEFGVRVALGAQSADIVRLVLGQALRLVGSRPGRRRRPRRPAAPRAVSHCPVHGTFDPAVVLPTALVLAFMVPRIRGVGSGAKSGVDRGVGGPSGQTEA